MENNNLTTVLSHDIDPITFAENIKSIRRSRCLTQQDVADRLGTHKATVSKYESGKMRRIKPQWVLDFATALNVTADELVDVNAQLEQQDYVNISNYARTHYIKLPKLLIKDYLHPSKLFYMIVKSDTATQVVNQGDMIIVSSVIQPSHLDLVLGSDGNVYKYYRTNGSYMLYTVQQSDNDFERGIYELPYIGKVIMTFKTW